MVSTTPAAAASGDPPKLVSPTVVAPRPAASASGSSTSVVVPECEIATSTSDGPVNATAVSAAWASVQPNAMRPMRCSFCWRSSATSPLAPMPTTSIRRAPAIASTAVRNAKRSSWAPVSASARASLWTIFAMTWSSESAASMSPAGRPGSSAASAAAAPASASRSCG